MRAQVRWHRPADAKEAADLAELLAFVERHPEPFDRGIAEGHLTGSAVVVSADGERVLLLHHRKLGRWLQPVVQPRAGRTVDLAALESHARSQLSGFKVPRSWEVRDSLPRTESGKLLKRVLRDEHWPSKGSQV